MRGYRISRCQYIRDLSGYGAYLYGGRWNSKGLHMLYTSSTPSLAMLEMIAHGIEAREEYCLAIIEIPEENILELKETELPAEWNQYPSPAQLREIGDNFLRENKYLILKVPSAIMSIESNLLINPQHENFKKIFLLESHEIGVDGRLQGR